jgi:preprotein translocase subunit SecE
MIMERMETPNTPKIPNVPPTRFLAEVISELKKVTWPSRDETMKLTAVVIVLSVAVGAFIGGLDAVLVQIQKLVFTK